MAADRAGGVYGSCFFRMIRNVVNYPLTPRATNYGAMSVCKIRDLRASGDKSVSFFLTSTATPRR